MKMNDNEHNELSFTLFRYRIKILLSKQKFIGIERARGYYV